MALTVDDRHTEVLGPRRREVIYVTSDATTAGTVASLIQNPQHVSVVGVDGSPTPADIQATVSGKTVTVTNPDTDESYRIAVEGF
jgi:hypothetical protein